ncbi:unnamed protein product [Rotaria sp. Silwood1]|nr:unnamed protein product [Rotaria sp. Silwood1]
MKLLDGLDGCYRTVVADNFFTSISLAKYLLEDDTYLIGTLRSNRVESGSKVLEENLSRGEVYGLQNKDGIKLIRLTIIPDGGCTESDWKKAIGPTAGRVALVKRGGSCAFADRAAQTPKFNVTGLLFYNDGILPDRMTPIEVSLGQDNALPALFLSYTAGEALAASAQNISINVTVQLGIDLKNLPDFSVGNICADTPTGNVTQTIVLGSHSDSVPAGPGINDNGSGSAANIDLAITLARLFKTPTYSKYKYRVRFCWWGAEEICLLGSKDHVKKAKNSGSIGERLGDYLINLNYDMLGSPNYIFGIYDGRTAKNDTPPTALVGSNKITDLFHNWFIQQKLLATLTDFDGRSDYGPFLAEGIVAGGLFSGADEIKSEEERHHYDQILGQGMDGIAGAAHDPCYHKACDSIQNINVFAYEKMVQAAAYVLEYLGRQDDLKDKLFNLKCFSLKSFCRIKQYNKIVSLLRCMSSLEKLTLYLPIKGRNRVIDGTYVQHDILDYMPQLHSFTFYICTYVKTVDLSYKLSSEDIQQTLTNIGQEYVTSIVNYIQGEIAAYSIFSLPFEFDYLKHFGNKFPNIVFSYVTFLLVEDTNPFKHEFFIRIARSFSLLKYLRIYNRESQVLDGLMTFSSDNCQLHSIIEYLHLTRLDVRYAHRDYVEQFLNETKAFIPCLTEFEVNVDDLKAVTKRFTREETRRNCAKVNDISKI